MLDDPFAPVDNYCERLDASFWAEPLNALTNGAFLIAALAAFVLWRRGPSRDGAALWLIAVTAFVGIGSFLFHTLANRWSLLADVIPIAVFIYSYFLLAMRRFLGLPLPAALAATGLFLAFSAGFEPLWRALAGPATLNGSAGYLPAALALLGVGGLARAAAGRMRAVARFGKNAAWGGEALAAERASMADRLRRAGTALLAAGAVFALSLVFRTIDEAVCGLVPTGTHFLWHALNAVVLFVLMRAAIAHGRRT